MTKQRLAVLGVIRDDMGCHHTAEEIYELAAKRVSHISRATVYNNLGELCRLGLIRKISGDGAADRYDSSPVPHGHAICTKCGVIWDFSLPEFDENIKEAIGRDFESYELKVQSVCDGCK